MTVKGYIKELKKQYLSQAKDEIKRYIIPIHKILNDNLFSVQEIVSTLESNGEWNYIGYASHKCGSTVISDDFKSIIIHKA